MGAAGGEDLSSIPKMIAPQSSLEDTKHGEMKLARREDEPFATYETNARVFM